MPTKTHEVHDDFETVPFRMHPRVFAALGADLVTNDVVAVIELVKNSYDAFAQNVRLRFGNDGPLGPFLEIEDDGKGMTKEIIENVWCIVATPYKELNPIVNDGEKKRRVAGEKGLGRLSVARLGSRLQMLTRAPSAPCWEVDIDWTDISRGDDFSKSFAKCRRYPGKPPFQYGTRLRIYNLKGQWDESQVLDLEENLARLISPFSAVGDFNIFLSGFDNTRNDEVEIESPEFLSKPKYSIQGDVDENGNVNGTYRFAPIVEGVSREKELTLNWRQVHDVIQDPTRFQYSPKTAHGGPFSFEIRAWDIAADDTQEIAENFNFRKSQVRKSIRAHKGISVYRDGILVLPKSDNARDWLGLDLRRVSKVGTRLSTSQLVGYVSISAENNPNIKDTSDRERLALCIQVAEFEEVLKAVVALLENERDEDRVKPDREKPMDDLFEKLSAEELSAEVLPLLEKGGEASEAIPLIRTFSNELNSARKAIQERFIYYSRLATVGTIAHMLVHEIRNRTTAFGSFLEYIQNRFAPFNEKGLKKKFHSAENAVDTLERLADTFAPLASRNFRRRKRQSILEEQIRYCLILHRGEIKINHVQCYLPDSKTEVAVDPGELDAIILNLVTNAVYWMREVPKEHRKLKFDLIKGEDRVLVDVQDTGPGIDKDDLQKVFLPGVTRKPNGIGMGLTVASELVAAYEGRMLTKYQGAKGGASFAFDLPLRKRD